MTSPSGGVDSVTGVAENRLMPTLYHAAGSRSCRVRWILEELGIAYELETLSFGDGSMRTPEYLAINPMGRVPSFDDDGVIFFESGAILEYILEKWGDGRLAPTPATPERALYLQWFFWSEATLLPPLGEIVRHAFLLPEEKRISAVVFDARKKLDQGFQMLDDALSGREYLVGKGLSAADIMAGYSCRLARMTGQLDAGFENVAAYLDRLSARSAFQIAFSS